MTKQGAIADFCKECAGGSAKEVTLCHLFDCPLWPWRTGTHVSSKYYTERITAGLENCSAEVAELVKMGVDITKFAVIPQEKPEPGQDSLENSPESNGLVAENDEDEGQPFVSFREKTTEDLG